MPDHPVRLGSAVLALPAAVAEQRPALADHAGRDVAVGIRSEDKEDARLVRGTPGVSRLRAVVTLVPHRSATRFVASFAPRSRVRAGDSVEVVVDTERMHFFAPDTGAAIRG